MRNKRELIEEFIDRVSLTGEVSEEWRTYVAAFREDTVRATGSDHRDPAADLPVREERHPRREEASRHREAGGLRRSILRSQLKDQLLIVQISGRRRRSPPMVSGAVVVEAGRGVSMSLIE